MTGKPGVPRGGFCVVTESQMNDILIREGMATREEVDAEQIKLDRKRTNSAAVRQCYRNKKSPKP